MSEYAKRDHAALGAHYVRHISAMTAEALHTKSAIAGELAWRDAEIERLRGERDNLARRNAELAARLAEIEAQPPVGNLHSHTDYGHEFTPRIPGDWSMLGADLYIRPVQATTSQ